MSEAFDTPIIMEIPMEIPESLYRLNDIMVGAKFEMYIAGGAVRDTILGKTPKDYDIATNASPLDAVKLLGPYVKRAEVQGEKSFAVARLIARDGNEYEFAPYRLESGSRSGGEAVLSTKENPLSIRHDVSRRDLTINALFYRIPTLEERKQGRTGEVLDYVGGIDDIKNEVIRTVGNPEDRFAEDRLRILRAFRFAGRVGGEIDEEAANAIRENNSLTEPSEAAVSSERIKEEIIKGVITSKVPSYYINMLIDFDLFPQILPGLKVSKSNSSSRNIAVQLATILIGNNHNDAASVLFDRKFGKIIKNSVKFLLELTSLNPDNLIELKNQVTRMKRTAKSILRNEDVIDFGMTIGQDFSRFVDFASAPPIMSAQDLIAGGLTPGPAIGEAMREAEIEAYFSESLPEPEAVDDSDIIDEASFYNHFVKTAMIENPLDIPVPSLSGEVYIFDMDDTFFWAPEWHTIIDTNNEGDAISVDMEFPNLFYKAISFVKMVNEDHTDFIKKGKRGDYIPELIGSYKEEVGELRLIRDVVDLPTLGKERQVVFVLSDAFGEPIDISMLKKYFPSKHLKVFDLRGKYVEGRAVIAGDASFYQSPKTLGHVVNEEILKIYNAHSSNAIILTARETMDGMQDGIRDRISSVGAKLPVAIFTKPTNISSGKYKAHIIGQIAQQEAVSSIEFYDDNLKYITDVNNILENVYGPDVHSKVSIHKVSVLNKPEESLFARLASKDNNTNMLKELIKIANELDDRGLVKESSFLDEHAIFKYAASLGDTIEVPKGHQWRVVGETVGGGMNNFWVLLPLHRGYKEWSVGNFEIKQMTNDQYNRHFAPTSVCKEMPWNRALWPGEVLCGYKADGFGWESLLKYQENGKLYISKKEHVITGRGWEPSVREEVVEHTMSNLEIAWAALKIIVGHTVTESERNFVAAATWLGDTAYERLNDYAKEKYSDLLREDDFKILRHILENLPAAQEGSHALTYPVQDWDDPNLMDMIDEAGIYRGRLIQRDLKWEGSEIIMCNKTLQAALNLANTWISDAKWTNYGFASDPLPEVYAKIASEVRSNPSVLLLLDFVENNYDDIIELSSDFGQYRKGDEKLIWEIITDNLIGSSGQDGQTLLSAIGNACEEYENTSALDIAENKFDEWAESDNLLVEVGGRLGGWGTEKLKDAFEDEEDQEATASP